MVSELIVIT